MYSAWHTPAGALTWHNAVFWATPMATAGAQRALATGDGDVATLMAFAGDAAELQTAPDAKLHDAMPGEQGQLADALPWCGTPI